MSVFFRDFTVASEKIIMDVLKYLLAKIRVGKALDSNVLFLSFKNELLQNQQRVNSLGIET